MWVNFKKEKRNLDFISFYFEKDHSLSVTIRRALDIWTDIQKPEYFATFCKGCPSLSGPLTLL
jgi:hypothetical protein